ITAPEYACPTRTTGPLVRSSAQLRAVASLLKDVSGIGAQITFRPRRSRGRTMLLQQDPSAHAAWTNMIVEFWGKSPTLACPGTPASTCAVCCAGAHSAKDPSSAAPSDVAAS